VSSDITTLTCMFSCKRCKQIDREFEVRVRSPNEDVREWMKVVIAAAGETHARWAPSCRTQELSDLKIPFSEKDGARVGDAVGPILS
jgi:hypothetical protein